ncbi:hypothetical protein OG389_33430 [Streptomyces sp. NBC_00435]
MTLSGSYGRTYSASNSRWARVAIAVSEWASWIELNALIWSVRMRASATSVSSMAMTGTTTDTLRRVPMASPAVMLKTNTPTVKANARQTIGSSRKSPRRGVNVLAENCTTRNSIE